MIISGIYQIVNTINGKSYIGSAKNTEKRWNRHKYDLGRGKHHSVYLQRSWIKYGESVFAFKILEQTDELFARETYWIDTLKPEYNLGSVGGGDNISKHPKLAEIKKKHSVIGKQRWDNLSEKEKQVFSDKRKGDKNGNWKGGIYSPKCLDCGAKISPYKSRCLVCSKLGARNFFYGKAHSPETKAILRQRRLGKLPTNAKKVEADGIVYDSANRAAKALGVCAATISFRVKSKHWNYRWI